MRLPSPLWLVGLSSACAQTEPVDLCEHFFSALEGVPHVTLSVSSGGFVSTWDGMEYRDCEIDFETNDSLRAGRLGAD